MEIYKNWAVAWLIAACLLAVAITIWDKFRARRRGWRVSESTLWLVALLGGSAAMYVAMLFVRHKTRHLRFMLGLPLLIAAQIGFLLFVWYKEYLIFI